MLLDVRYSFHHMCILIKNKREHYYEITENTCTMLHWVLKFMISKIWYNLTDPIACELNNIDSGRWKISISVVEKQQAWNEGGADLYSAAGEVKYANKYVLDFVSLICRSSGRCYLITVLSRQLWRDQRSSIIIFKERICFLFLGCLTYSNGLNLWLTSCGTTSVFATFCFRARPLWTKVRWFHQHQGPGTRPSH